MVDALRIQSKLRYFQNRIDEAVELAEAAIAECRKGPREAEGLGDKYHLLQVLLWKTKLMVQINDRSTAIDTLYTVGGSRCGAAGQLIVRQRELTKR